ncbi:response regulator transcription factor [Bacteroidota bacterium]
MANAKILLVDDDRDLIESTKVILESQDYSVETAFNGAEGIEKFKSCNPDLIILDVMMESDLSGYNALHKFKKENNSIPIIMMTGISETMGVNLRSGVEDDDLFSNVSYLDKPVDPEVLFDEVKRLLKE